MLQCIFIVLPEAKGIINKDVFKLSLTEYDINFIKKETSEVCSMLRQY